MLEIPPLCPFVLCPIGLRLQAFWGSLSDKYGRRKILLTALTVNLAGGLTCALVQTFWELILCRTICGLGVRIPFFFNNPRPSSSPAGAAPIPQ